MTLPEAIAQAYAAFADMPRPKQIRHESWELEAGEEKALVTRPLRELSSGLMRSYLFDSVYHVGTWDDFRYFLPRLLELSPQWYRAGHDIEIDISGRLRYAQEQGLPLTDAQRRALHDYGLAFWGDMLPDYAVFADMYLSWKTFEPFGVTRSELLSAWWTHSAGALALAYVLLAKGTPPAEWPRAEVLTWLERAFFAESDEDNRQSLSDSILILEAMPNK